MSVKTQGDQCYVTHSMLFQVSAFTFDSCRPNFGGVLTELTEQSFTLVFLSKAPASTLNKHGFGSKCTASGEIQCLGACPGCSPCGFGFRLGFFLGVHPCDKRAARNCFHSITLSVSLQHSDGLQR